MINSFFIKLIQIYWYNNTIKNLVKKWSFQFADLMKRLAPMYFFDSVFETNRENNPEVSGYTQKRSDESEENSNAEFASDFESLG